MAVNIIDLVQRNLSGPVMRQISSLLGESEATTQSAVALAVPTAVGALIKQASSPSGARDLSSQLDRTDTSFLGNLTSSLTSGAKGMMDVGSNLTRSLFGSQLNAVNDGLSRASGMGKGAITSLMALITPVVLGVLSKVKKEQNLDASGLSNLLGDQSTFVSGVLPAGLGNALGIPNAVSSAGSTVRATAERVGDYAKDTGRAAVRTTERAAQEGTSIAKKLLPIAAIVALGIIAWGWLARRSENPVDAARSQHGVVPAEQTELASLVDSAANALRGVTDVESAKAAVPKLQSTTRSIEFLSSRLGAMSTSARESLASTASAATTQLQTLGDKALGIPGVSEVLTPALTSLRDALRKLRA